MHEKLSIRLKNIFTVANVDINVRNPLQFCATIQEHSPGQQKCFKAGVNLTKAI